MGTDKVLRLLGGYTSEHNYTVWENLTGNIADLNRLLSNTDFHSQFKKFAVGLFQNVVDHLGWKPRENEQPLDSMLRGLVLAAHGNYGNPDTLDMAAAKFKDHCDSCDKQRPSPLPVDLRGVVYQLAMRQGDMEIFDKIFQVSHVVCWHFVCMYVYVSACVYVCLCLCVCLLVLLMYVCSWE